MKCTATSSRTKEHCKAWAVKGATVCRVHGGRAPQVKAAAARRVVEAKALKAVQGLGGWAPVTDPLSALADVAGEVLAVKDHLRGLVGRIVERERAAEQDAAISDGVARLTGEPVGLRVPDDKGAEQMRAEFTAYMAMLNSAVATLATIAKLNIDERMARIDEMRAEMIREALRRTFAEMGVAGEQQVRAFGVLGRHLKVVRRESDG